MKYGLVRLKLFLPRIFLKFASERDCDMEASRLVIFWSYSEGEPLTTTSNCCLNLEFVISMTVSFRLVQWEVHSAYFSIINNYERIIQIEPNSIERPTGRRQVVSYLQTWPRMCTRNDLEQIQQATRVGLEHGTVGLLVRRTDHSATMPS